FDPPVGVLFPQLIARVSHKPQRTVCPLPLGSETDTSVGCIE
ncbi:MAG: hypothetical protein ACI88S_001635, partial [Ilumatobacter sp.]